MQVPDGLVGFGEMLGQKATAIFLGKNAGETDRSNGANVQQIHHQNIAWLSTLYVDGARQWVSAGQVNVAYVVGAVRVLDLGVQKVHALQNHFLARLHAGQVWNIRVPSVVPDFSLLGQGCAGFDFYMLHVFSE